MNPSPAPSRSSRSSNTFVLWILGGCGLIVVAFGVGLLIGLIYVVSHSPRANSPEPSDHSTWTSYINSKAPHPKTLQDQLVDFSFRYPTDRFKLIPHPVNFVKLEKRKTGKSDDVPLETMDIAPFKSANSKGAGKDQDVLYRVLLQQASKIVEAQCQGYKVVEEQEYRIGNLMGRALLFSGTVDTKSESAVHLYGKIIVVRKPEAEYGLLLILAANAVVPGVGEAQDVGVKGDLGAIMKTFGFRNQ